jgi:cytochrome c
MRHKEGIMYRYIILSLLLLLPAIASLATEVPTTILGQQMFAASNLGTNGKSCASCHPDGKGLEEINAYDDDMLKEMVNFCIRDAQKGRMMDLQSTEIESFLLYLRSLK